MPDHDYLDPMNKQLSPDESADLATTNLVMEYNSEFDFSFCYPEGWFTTDVEPTQPGARRIHALAYSPVEGDLSNCLAFEAVVLDFKVKEEDLELISQGFRDGLDQIEGSLILYQNAAVTPDGVLILEARQAFGPPEVKSARWVKLLSRGKTQIRVVAQSSTISGFEEYLPLYYECFRQSSFGNLIAALSGESATLS